MFNYAGRDKAPEPVIKPPVIKGEHGPEIVEPPAPVVDKKDEPEPFVWDFAAFKSALKGV